MVFFYICFAVSCFSISEAIPYSAPLAFCYTFGFVQVIQICPFIRLSGIYNIICMNITLFTGCVMPTFQIYMVMQGMSSDEINRYFGCIYLLKEMILYIATRAKYGKYDPTNPILSTTDKVTCLGVLIWIVFNYMTPYIPGDMLQCDDATIKKIGEVLYFSPAFCFASMTLSYII
jgi:hypothetical protein